jgi:hypothetical protein
MSQESSLIRSSRNIKKFFLYFVIFVIAYYSWGGIVTLLSNIPNDNVNLGYTPYRDADEVFGRIALPLLDPQLAIANSSNPIFTITGSFATFPDKMFVYSVHKPTETFLTVTRANESANRMGFQNSTSDPDDLIIKWSDTNRNLEMNKDGLKWKLISSESFIEEIITRPPKNQSIEDAINEISTNIRAIGLPHTENLNFSDPKYLPIEINPNSLMGFNTTNNQQDYILIINERIIDRLPLKSASRAEELILEQGIDKRTKIYGFNPHIGHLYTIFNSKYVDSENIIAMTYNPMRVGTHGVYRIVNPFEAFTRLQEGSAQLRSIRKSDNQLFDPHEILEIREFNVNASQTELAYFSEDQIEDNSYTYPIYIFRGNAILSDGEIAEFIFYVDALDFG